MVSTAAFHAKFRGSFPGLGSLKEAKMFLPHPLVKLCIVGSLRDREVAGSASDIQGLNFKSLCHKLYILTAFMGVHPICLELGGTATYLSLTCNKP